MQDLNHNMEPAFAREFCTVTTQVPDYLLANYQNIGLSDQQFIDLLRVLACQQKFAPYVEQERLLYMWQGKIQDMQAALAGLQQQGVLQRQEDLPGQPYSLAGLYAKLLELWVFQHTVPAAAESQASEQTAPAVDEREIIRAAYQLFEGEFARPLSPLEMEKLNAWLIADRWDLALLREAMRRAVLHNALNLAYIDKILLRWRREGIATLEALQVSEERMEAQTGSDGQNKRSRKTAGKGKAAEPGFGSEVDYGRYF